MADELTHFLRTEVLRDAPFRICASPKPRSPTSSTRSPSCATRQGPERRLLPLLRGRRHRLRPPHPPPRLQHALRLQHRARPPLVRRPAGRCAARTTSCAPRTCSPAAKAMPGRSIGTRAKATVRDGTNHCYGLALCCWPTPTRADVGVPGAAQGIADTFELMERRFWLPEHGLYADEATPDWQVGSYRARTPTCTAARPCWQHTLPRRGPLP